MLAPALARFVETADEGGRRSVALLDDPGLSVQKRRIDGGDDANLYPAARQQFVELLVTRTVHEAVRSRRVSSLPSFLSAVSTGDAGCLADGNARGSRSLLQDDLDLVDPGDVLADQLEDR